MKLLLQAGDDKFKAELGWVVNLDMWEAAKQLAAQKLKDFTGQLASVTSQEQLRLTDLIRLDSQVALRETHSNYHYARTMLTTLAQDVQQLILSQEVECTRSGMQAAHDCTH